MITKLSIFIISQLLTISLCDLEEKYLTFNDPEQGPVERLYLQYLPSNYNDLDNIPLVLDFHGFSMTADGQRQYSQWDILAEEEGFVAVFPEGVPYSPSELRGVNIVENKNY